MFEVTGPAIPFGHSYASTMDAVFGPYIPPCERNPWYKDPRDREITVEQAIKGLCEFYAKSQYLPFI